MTATENIGVRSLGMCFGMGKEICQEEMRRSLVRATENIGVRSLRECFGMGEKGRKRYTTN